MKYNILVAEDQKEISNIISKYLENDGYFYKIAKDGFEALEYFSKEEFHIVILDIMMPGIDGFQVLSEIRKVSGIPVIFLTAKQEESDRLKGFDLGGDDYIIKPFSPRELMRRIKVLIKRVYKESDYEILKCFEYTLHMSTQKLYNKNLEIPITTTEFSILKVFFQNKGQVLSREQIIELAFGNEYDGFDRSIDTSIKRIRQKIEDNPKNPKLLITKYGAGYVFGGKK